MFEEMHDAGLDDLHLKALRPHIVAALRSGAGIIRFELCIRQLWLMMLGSSRCTCSLALVPAEAGGWYGRPGQESECNVVSG
jgi:hypothetical protein